METTAFLTRLRDLIARNELPTAIEQLRVFLDNSPKLDEALLQSARFQDIRRQIRLGTVSHEDAHLTQNQIRTGLLDLLQEIERDTTTGGANKQPDPNLQAEVEQAIFVVNSKNVIVGSTISAGGDVHIGDTHKTVVQNAEKIYNIEKIDNANFS